VVPVVVDGRCAGRKDGDAVTRDEQKYVYIVSVGERATYRIIGVYSSEKLARSVRHQRVNDWNRDAAAMREHLRQSGRGGAVIDSVDREIPRIERWPLDPLHGKETLDWAMVRSAKHDTFAAAAAGGDAPDGRSEVK
jgi:hypothetical protein